MTGLCVTHSTIICDVNKQEIPRATCFKGGLIVLHSKWLKAAQKLDGILALTSSTTKTTKLKKKKTATFPHRLGAAGYGWTDHICPGLLKTIPIIPVVSTRLVLVSLL